MAYQWGEVVHIYQMSRYAIIEFFLWGKSTAGGLTPNTRYTQYAPYIDEKEIGQSFLSLERAIVAAIAYSVEGLNHYADYYFFKMIEPDE